MVIHDIIKAVSYCPYCSAEKTPVRMKYIGDKTACDKHSLYYVCKKCKHYFESYVKGPNQIDDFHI